MPQSAVMPNYSSFFFADYWVSFAFIALPIYWSIYSDIFQITMPMVFPNIWRALQYMSSVCLLVANFW